MLVVNLPSFPTPTEALDWLERQGETLHVCLMRGPDGMIRGSALIRPKEARP